MIIAQRGDPKDEVREQFFGPQDDTIRVENYVQYMRGSGARPTPIKSLF